MLGIRMIPTIVMPFPNVDIFDTLFVILDLSSVHVWYVVSVKSRAMDPCYATTATLRSITYFSFVVYLLSAQKCCHL